MRIGCGKERGRIDAGSLRSQDRTGLYTAEQRGGKNERTQTDSNGRLTDFTQPAGYTMGSRTERRDQLEQYCNHGSPRYQDTGIGDWGWSGNLPGLHAVGRVQRSDGNRWGV